MERNYIKQSAIIEALEKWDSSDLLCFLLMERIINGKNNN